MAKKSKSAPLGPVAIPSYVVEYFLLGQTRKGSVERFTQDGGIVIDVWLEFAKDLFRPLRVLLAPNDGVRTVDLGFALHNAVSAYRNILPPEPGFPAQRERLNVSPLENFVAATIYLDELLRVVLPLTRWWNEKNLRALHRTAIKPEADLRARLYRSITIRCGHGDEGGLAQIRQQLSDSDAGAADGPAANEYPSRRIIEAAPIAALIGVFCATMKDRSFIADVPPPAGFGSTSSSAAARGPQQGFLQWVWDSAPEIAEAATDELGRPFDLGIFQHALTVAPADAVAGPEPSPPALIARVFLNREAHLADTEAICTVKADAATRLFEISCRTMTWAIIDAGIDSTHPAFIDRGARPGRPPSRVRATVDFTLIHEIRNFDLTVAPRDNRIAEVLGKLAALPGRQPTPGFEDLAKRNLNAIADQLNMRALPDWSLIEPLIRIDRANGSGLTSSHGTHVAGILGADWRHTRTRPPPGAAPPEEVEEIVLQGICPDINLYDLRVVTAERESTEFGLLAALEYVQYVNLRSVATGPVVHGVNISLSIPHDVRNYGCGATPVCVACDRLALSGVVVVAAAGNRGWNEQEIGFGNFVFCSITDPGNARHVLTVGSTHRANPHTYGVSYFSSRGPTGDGRVKPDLVAPGEKIRGPIRGNADDRLDGTSMAAPYVSGAAAMLMTRNRELIGNALRVKDILCRSATDLGREKYFQGNGLVDVLRALQSI